MSKYSIDTFDGTRIVTVEASSGIKAVWEAMVAAEFRFSRSSLSTHKVIYHRRDGKEVAVGWVEATSSSQKPRLRSL